MANQPTTTGLIGLVAVGLKPNAEAVLKAAAERGFISPPDIASIIPAQVGKNHLLLKKSVDSIRACLDVLGVVIVLPAVADQLLRSRAEKAKESPGPLTPATARPIPKKEPVRASKVRAEKPEKEGPEETEEGSGWVDYYDKDLLGIYMKSLRPYKRLTDGEVAALAEQSRNGDTDARNKLVVHNLKLAVKMAFNQRWRIRETSLTLLDLIQEGNVGLMTAAEEFDERRGNKFSTYAYWWVFHKMVRAVQEDGRLVRVPIHAQELWHKVQRTRAKFMRRFGHEPKLRSIAALVGVSEEVIENALKDMRLVPGHYTALIELDGDWDKPPEDQENRPFYEAIADTGELRPDQLIQAKEELQQACHRLRLVLGVAKFSSLTPRDIEMFVARYGLDGSFQVKTLEAVAERYKPMTRERVRQIVDLRVWPKLRELGVKQDDEWLREELQRIRLLEDLTGEAARL